MRVMQLDAPGQPLRLVERPIPEPGPGSLVRVIAWRLRPRSTAMPPLRSPIVPGHEIVGRIAASARRAGLAIGQRVGVPWLGHTCGCCPYCRSGRENLCDAPGFTGWSRDGGYADYVLADAAFGFPILTATTTWPRHRCSAPA